jgi:WG containing repeat
MNNLPENPASANDLFLIPYRIKEKHGYCTPDKKIVIDCIYENTNPFSEGLAAVMLNNKMGCIDKTGKLVIPYKYDFISLFKEGIAFAEMDGKCGYIDKTGKEIIPFIYSEAGEFNDGIAIVELNGKLGYIDTEGHVVIPCRYELATPFENGIAYVELNDKEFYIDKTGKKVQQPDGNEDDNYYDGLISVSSDDDNFMGFRNKAGELVIPCTFDYAEDFSEGRAMVCMDDKYGFIDTTGKLVIPCIYDSLTESFSDGITLVELDDDLPGYIGLDGTQYWED